MRARRALALVVTALALVGLLAAESPAAILDSVRVVAPETGGVIGIDSVITAEAFFRTTGPDSNVRVLFWLNSQTTHRVVADTTRNNSALLDSIRSATLGSVDSVRAADIAFVAAGRSLYKAASNIVGDADTMVVANGPVTASGYSWKVTWKYRLHPSVSEVSNVTVWCSVRDSLGTPRTFTVPQAARRSWAAYLDGDRPEIPPGAFLLPVNTFGGTSVGGFGGLGNITRTVLGLGDTVNVRYDLGLRADSTILTNNLSVICRFAYGSTTQPIDLGLIRHRVDSVYVTVNAGQFGTAFARIDTSSSFGLVEMFLRENASGNISSYTGDALLVPGKDDVVPIPITTAANFVIDAVAPVLDGGVVAGDTLLPVSGGKLGQGQQSTEAARDTLKFGSDDPASSRYAPVKSALILTPPEALRRLWVRFDNGSESHAYGTIGFLDQFTTEPNDFLLGGRTYLAYINGRNIWWWGNRLVSSVMTRKAVAQSLDTAVVAITDGVYTMRCAAVDIAGNVGPELVRTNVYVDLTPITLARLFPAKAAFGPVSEARVDTIEETTSPVRFALSEPADSVVIRYEAIAGKDTLGIIRTRKLAGDELANTALARYAVVGLVDSTTYRLTVLARDLSGNYSISGPDTLRYDTSYVVPLIKRFKVEVNAAKKGVGVARQNTAGDTVIINLTADASLDGHRNAVTYEGASILTIGGGDGVTLSGSGVTQIAPNKVSLSTDGWSAGKRQVVLRDTVGYDSLQITIADTTLSGGPYIGALDSTVVYQPDDYVAIVVTAPTTATAGTAFAVNARLVDQFRNTRVFDKRFLVITTNKLGVEIPQGPLWVQNGVAWFPTTATLPTTGLTYLLTDFYEINKDFWSLYTNGIEEQIKGVSNPVTVVAATVPAVDAPDTLVAQDYKGADGQGDQGGFVLLTFPVSADHATLTGYRIYRSVKVNVGTNGAGLGTLETPASVMMPWGAVDAVPGESVMRVVVATLDTVSSHWAVAAERGAVTSGKEAFGAAATSVTTPYELMANTMVASRQAAVAGSGPVFATLTPEALAFGQQGVVPSFKTVAGVELSAQTQTAMPVRATDDIAPVGVTGLRAMDTPSDAGSSITVTWTASVSDAQLPRFAGNAVSPGVTGDVVAGVAGYNVYRKMGTGSYERVGQVAAGQTSFADLTALNGVRYTYKVQPYDQDNEPVASVERTAMSIRNNVLDAQGRSVYGLFGSDSKVGFDDFFLFADNFGVSAGQDGWEPAFDLSPNGRVDFEDFFVFADNFGRGTGVEASGKVVPVVSGLNTAARLTLDAGTQLPGVGEEVTVGVRLSDFVELKGYGLSVAYDADKLEYVGVSGVNEVLGTSELSSVRVLSQTPGLVSVGAYGTVATSGTQALNLVFRTKGEIETSLVEVTEGAVRDGSYLVNVLATPSPVVIQTRPESYALGNNYPNPFNPSTTIKYALPAAGAVRLEVYNVVGQVVRTLVNGPQSAGRYAVQWDATDNQGASLSSGIYFYRLQAGDNFLEVKKMLLLK